MYFTLIYMYHDPHIDRPLSELGTVHINSLSLPKIPIKISLIWKARWSSGKILFIATRYPIVLEALVWLICEDPAKFPCYLYWCSWYKRYSELQWNSKSELKLHIVIERENSRLLSSVSLSHFWTHGRHWYLLPRFKVCNYFIYSFFKSTLAFLVLVIVVLRTIALWNRKRVVVIILVFTMVVSNALRNETRWRN